MIIHQSRLFLSVLAICSCLFKHNYSLPTNLVTQNSTLNSSNETTVKTDPFVYLTKYGYLDSKYAAGLNVSFKKTSRNYVNVELAVKQFQKLARLNVTGKLDNATVEAMQLPRCGNPDIFRTKSKRHVLQGSKWAKPVVKFKVRKYPKYSVMDREEINNELKRAFDLWAEYANIEFALDIDESAESGATAKPNFVDSAAGIISSEPVDIDVRFENGFHGDSEPFDGRGLILGNDYFLRNMHVIPKTCYDLNLHLIS
jgi:hypothetical protein